MTKSQIKSSQNQSYNHTFHSSVRANQRGISNDDILFVIQNSKPVYKQNFCFYSLKNSIYYTGKFLNDHLINMVVLVDDKTNTIITVYKSEKAWKKIKQKSKRLSKRKSIRVN